MCVEIPDNAPLHFSKVLGRLQTALQA